MNTDKDTRISTKSKNKKIRISVLNLTAFLFLYVINMLFFLIFRGYFFLVMGLIFTVLVPLSLYTAWRLADHIEGTICVEKETVRPGEENTVVLSVTNSGFLCALRGTWHLTVGNSFYQTFDRQKLLLSIPPHGKKQFPMTVTMTDLGQIVFACREFILTDLLGIFAIHTDCTAEGCLCVLPASGASDKADVPNTYSGIAELSESNQKGHDHSEVSDIRSYIAGDRPRDIHWKLSARQRELMVKERVSLAGSEHILLLELPSDKHKADKLLTEGYHRVEGMLDRNMSVRLLVWNERLFSFESYSCGDLDELDTAYCEIFHTALSAHTSDLLQQYMKNFYPQLNSYMRVAQREETIQLEICANG